MSRTYAFAAATGILCHQHVVAVDARTVRARRREDPPALLLAIAEHDVLSGQEARLDLDERTWIVRTADALDAGARCCLAADGQLRVGLLTPYGPGRPATALHAAPIGDDVVVRFDLEGQEELFPPPEESLERLGAALEALTVGPAGVTVPPCPASDSSTARS